MAKSEKLVEVYRAAEMEAEVIRGMLECIGIPALLKYEAAGRIYGVTVDGLGEVRVLVPESKAQEARDAIVAEKPCVEPEEEGE